MEDTGVIEEKKEPGRRKSAVVLFDRTGWEGVVFLIEEIEEGEAGEPASTER